MAPSPIQQVSLRYSFEGQPMENVLHVHNGGDPELRAPLDDIAAIFDGVLGGNIKAMLTEGGRYVETHVRDVAVPGHTDPPQERVSRAHAGVGTRGGTWVAPSEVCALLKLETTVAERGSHGWLRLPPAVAGADLGLAGVFDEEGAYASAIDDFVTNLATLLPGGSGWGEFDEVGIVVYSPTRTARESEAIWFDVSSFSVDLRWHWLRSRAAR